MEEQWWMIRVVFRRKAGNEEEKNLNFTRKERLLTSNWHQNAPVDKMCKKPYSVNCKEFSERKSCKYFQPVIMRFRQTERHI